MGSGFWGKVEIWKIDHSLVGRDVNDYHRGCEMGLVSRDFAWNFGCVLNLGALPRML